MTQNITIPTKLFMTVTRLCTYTEAKIILALYGAPDRTTEEMLALTGIQNSNNYFAARKRLERMHYIFKAPNGCYYVNKTYIVKQLDI